MKVASAKCPACGGAISIDEEHPVSFCPYCGVAIKRDETSMDELRLKLAHEEKMAMHNANVEKEERKSKNRQFWLCMLAMLGLMLLFMFFSIVAKFLDF